MLKRLVLATILFICLYGSALADECRVGSEGCLAWTDLNRFMIVAKICVLGGVTSQAMAMIQNAMNDGVAIEIPRGTKLNVIHRDNTLTIVEIKGIRMCIISTELICK